MAQVQASIAAHDHGIVAVKRQGGAVSNGALPTRTATVVLQEGGIVKRGGTSRFIEVEPERAPCWVFDNRTRTDAQIDVAAGVDASRLHAERARGAGRRLWRDDAERLAILHAVER